MDDCIFCKIVRGEIPSKKVYEDDHSFAFLDINPRNPGHTLVIPKNHSQDILSIEEGDASELMVAITRVARGVQKATGAKGINLTQNNGQLAGQVVPHIHFHIIPRTEAEKGAALESVLPVKQQEEAALDSMARKISGSIEKPSPEPVSEKPEPEESEPEQSSEDEAPEKDTRSPEKQKIDFEF